MQQKIIDRSQITLWIIASKFSENFSIYIEGLTPIGEGVQRGTLAQFPIYQIDLDTLPITLATFPLLMVYKGNVERERAIVQFFIEHYQEVRELGYFTEILHPQALKEVLEMLDIESLRGFDLDLPAILDLFETEKIIQNIGMENIIRTFGTENLAKVLSSSLTDEEKERFIDRIRQLGESKDKTEQEKR